MRIEFDTALSRLIGRHAASAELFDTATEVLTAVTGWRFAAVGRLCHDRARVELLSAAQDGANVPTWTYALEGTPCHAVYKCAADSPYWYIETGLAARYPEDTVLAERGFDAYRGELIFADDGAPLGHVFMMHDRAGPDADQDRLFFRLVAQRVMAELNRRETERTLKEREELLNSIFDNVPIGLMIKNKSHVVERLNDTYVRWYGDRVSDLVGFRSDALGDMHDDDDADLMHAQERRVIDTGETVRRRIERLFADGERHVVEITKFPIYDQEGRIARVGSASIDLTEQVRAQEAARRALEEAERANQAKSEFIATMSHEFRTPLNAILGFSEMLRAQYHGPLGATNYEHYAADIHASGELILSLVNDILDLSAIEAGKRTITRVDIALAPLVDDCVKTFQQLADDKQVAVVNGVDPALPALVADERALRQILLNLLSNAIKFTDAGGRVTVEAVSDARGTAVRVSDTGVGVPGDILHAITEPFFQSHTDPHRAQEGTGLGLSIVKSLMELHDGVLELESVEGQGTAATVIFPA